MLRIDLTQLQPVLYGLDSFHWFYNLLLQDSTPVVISHYQFPKTWTSYLIVMTVFGIIHSSAERDYLVVWGEVLTHISLMIHSLVLELIACEDIVLKFFIQTFSNLLEDALVFTDNRANSSWLNGISHAGKASQIVWIIIDLVRFLFSPKQLLYRLQVFLCLIVFTHI